MFGSPTRRGEVRTRTQQPVYYGSDMLWCVGARTLRAVRAGIRIQQAVKYHRVQQSLQEAPFDFGVGINTGPALVGNLGAQWRYSYTAIGDTVNLAARITGAAPAGEIWISQATRRELPVEVVVEPLPSVKFKGKSQETSLFRVLHASTQM